MKVQKDYEEFLELLNRSNVKYVIVGSYALAYHAKPRYTKDMDIFIEPTVENATAILQAIKDFGFPEINLTSEDIIEEDKMVQLGYEPVRIDILSSLSGCTFSEVWNNRIKGKYGDTEVYFIRKDDLIKNKRASGRKQDIVDIDLLKNT
jgi:predicted nucleotidyltransferase